MRKQSVIWIIAFLLVTNLAFASYYYEPMNFDSPTNHSFSMDTNGFIEVYLPANFTLLSGNTTGNNSVSFIARSPNTTAEDLYVGTILVNGSHYSDFYFISIPDNKIVDNKIEIGHGDFNYINSGEYISDEEQLLFSIIRLWPIGSNILNEPATNVTLTCIFPDGIPRTVDSKYTTTFNSTNVVADGYLSRMEGISMFRIFVLSQEVDLDIGDLYNVSCTELSYYFDNTRIVADISDIGLEARSTEPLIVSGYNDSIYKTFTILNNESYEVRDLEFLWFYDSHTYREELDNLAPGEMVMYHLPIDEELITFGSRFIPSWMFNSRAPTIYEQVEYFNFTVPSTNITIPANTTMSCGNIEYIFVNTINFTNLNLTGCILTLNDVHVLDFNADNATVQIRFYSWDGLDHNLSINSSISQNVSFNITVDSVPFSLYDNVSYYTTIYPVNSTEIFWVYTLQPEESEEGTPVYGGKIPSSGSSLSVIGEPAENVIEQPSFATPLITGNLVVLNYESEEGLRFIRIKTIYVLAFLLLIIIAIIVTYARKRYTNAKRKRKDKWVKYQQPSRTY